jgi:DNA-binding MurR/RpiR family transcriptional regulator
MPVNLQPSFQERIRQQRAGFSRSYSRLADFLLDSYLQACLMTANEIAQALDLDPATVVRFAQHLGYSGFPVLQHEMRSLVRSQFLPSTAEQDPLAAFEHASQALKLTQLSLPLAQLGELVEKLASARQILLLADPAAAWLVARLAADLVAAGFPAQHMALEPHSLAAVLSAAAPDDLLLAVDLSGESPVLLRALKAAHDSGLTVALVAGAASLPSAGIASITLSVYGAGDLQTRLACAAVVLQAVEQSLRRLFPERFASSQARLAELSRKLEPDN